VALAGVSLAVAARELVAVPGKSTLLQLTGPG